MMNMHKRLFMILALCLPMMACAGTGFDLKGAAETSVHLKLLDAEFDMAVSKVESLPLNESERAVISQSVAELQVERQFLRTLHEQSVGRVALTGLQAQKHLDDISDAYRKGRDVYISHLDRTGQRPDPLLESFDDSARIAHGNVQKTIDAGGGVSGDEMAKYLSLALRTFAAINGVPLVLPS